MKRIGLLDFFLPLLLGFRRKQPKLSCGERKLLGSVKPEMGAHKNNAPSESDMDDQLLALA